MAISMNGAARQIPMHSISMPPHGIRRTHKVSMLGGPLPDLDYLAGLAGSKHPTAGAAHRPVGVAEGDCSIRGCIHRHVDVPCDHCCAAVGQLGALYGTYTCRAPSTGALTAAQRRPSFRKLCCVVSQQLSTCLPWGCLHGYAKDIVHWCSEVETTPMAEPRRLLLTASTPHGHWSDPAGEGALMAKLATSACVIAALSGKVAFARK